MYVFVDGSWESFVGGGTPERDGETTGRPGEDSRTQTQTKHTHGKSLKTERKGKPMFSSSVFKGCSLESCNCFLYYMYSLYITHV